MEAGVHGPRWQTLHSGYFSDPAVAAPFLDVVQKAIRDSAPQVIVDLGGGTGFILGELLRRSPGRRVRLVNLDLSQKQLAAESDNRIIRICRSITAFERSEAADRDARFLFIMRSALHYLGRDGLTPFLRHMRSQMKKGELFVHQTACCDSAADSRCLNRLYHLMETGKWYPTTKHLLGRLEKAGWSVESNIPAPMLTLTSDELGRRYRLGKRRLAEIRQDLMQHFGGNGNVLRPASDGFCAYLPYRIFTCRATETRVPDSPR